MDLCSLLQVLTLDPFAPHPRLTFLPRGRPCSFAVMRSRKLCILNVKCVIFFLNSFRCGSSWGMRGFFTWIAAPFPGSGFCWPLSTGSPGPPPRPASRPASQPSHWRSPPCPSSSSHAISPLGSSCLLSLHTDWRWGHSLSPPQTGLGDQPFLSRFPEHTPGWAWGPFFSSPVLCPASRTLQVAGPLRSVPVCADRCALVSDVTL